MDGAIRAANDEASWLTIERTAGETLRTALERTLRRAIREGSLRAGVRLPSSRDLARQLGVSRGVASDAYTQLASQGFLLVEPRQAPVVAQVAPERRRAALVLEPERRPIRFDFLPTTPDVTLFPATRWAAALARAARSAPARVFDYGDSRGDDGLRRTLADMLGWTRGLVTDPTRIVVVQGTAQGFDLVLRVLHGRGERRIAVEDPSLHGRHRGVDALGLEAVPCAVDDDGIAVGPDLDAAAAIVTPAHQFPTGVVLTGARRRALLAWARARDAIVIEDDYDAEFRYDREPIRALQGLDPERVVYIGTVSKTLAPALRLGWVVAPPELAPAIAAAKRRTDFGSPTLDQLALQHLIESGDYDRHVRRMRTTYHVRRDRLTAVLARRLPELSVKGIAAGLHLLLELPAGVDDTRVALEAERRGVRVDSLSSWTIRRRNATGLILGYGRLHESAIEDAVDELAGAIETVAQAG